GRCNPVRRARSVTLRPPSGSSRKVCKRRRPRLSVRGPAVPSSLFCVSTGCTVGLEKNKLCQKMNDPIIELSTQWTPTGGHCVNPYKTEDWRQGIGGRLDAGRRTGLFDCGLCRLSRPRHQDGGWLLGRRHHRY